MKKKLLSLNLLFLMGFFSLHAQINTVRYSTGNEIRLDSLRNFHKGFQSHYTVRDATGQVIESPQFTVKSIQKNADGTVAKIEIQGKKKSTIEWIFSADKLWINLTSEWLQMALLNMSELKLNENSNNISLENGMWSLPLKLNTGESLGDINFNFSATLDDEPVKINVHFTNRNIERIEELQTSAGKFEVYKINALCTSTIEKNGKTKEWLKPSNEILWMDTRYGIIKRESQNLRGKMNWMRYLSAVKE